jgi:hypothetical protein
MTFPSLWLKPVVTISTVQLSLKIEYNPPAWLTKPFIVGLTFHSNQDPSILPFCLRQKRKTNSGQWNVRGSDADRYGEE